MTGNTHSNRFVCWGSIIFTILAGNVAQAAQNDASTHQIIEVFASADLSITGEAAIVADSARAKNELQIYELDGIQRIEAKLSKDLSADSEQSKRIVLQRLQKLGAADRAQMQLAAMGLAKAVQYGVNRYPAIVFDGQMVVYGVTDLEAALQYYRAWRTGSQP